jgi:hypothetical protein
MPDPQPPTHRQIAWMDKLANANHAPLVTRESQPREHRDGSGASRLQLKRTRGRTNRIQMVQSYLHLHD